MRTYHISLPAGPEMGSSGPPVISNTPTLMLIELSSPIQSSATSGFKALKHFQNEKQTQCCSICTQRTWSMLKTKYDYSKLTTGLFINRHRLKKSTLPGVWILCSCVLITKVYLFSDCFCSDLMPMLVVFFPTWNALRCLFQQKIMQHAEISWTWP